MSPFNYNNNNIDYKIYLVLHLSTFRKEKKKDIMSYNSSEDKSKTQNWLTAIAGPFIGYGNNENNKIAFHQVGLLVGATTTAYLFYHAVVTTIDTIAPEGTLYSLLIHWGAVIISFVVVVAWAASAHLWLVTHSHGGDARQDSYTHLEHPDMPNPNNPASRSNVVVVDFNSNSGNNRTNKPANIPAGAQLRNVATGSAHTKYT